MELGNTRLVSDMVPSAVKISTDDWSTNKAGNVLFPGWEYFIPKVGTTQDNKERVLRNKGWLLNNKGWLLENKRRLSLDLTWFLGKVPK